MKYKFALVFLAIITCGAFLARADDPVQPWRENVIIRPVSEEPERHSIHSYYVANPESPDGRHLLFFTSTDPAGYVGEVRLSLYLNGL